MYREDDEEENECEDAPDNDARDGPPTRSIQVRDRPISGRVFPVENSRDGRVN